MVQSITVCATRVAHMPRRYARSVVSATVLGIGLFATAAAWPDVATIRARPRDGSPTAFTTQRGAGVSLQQAIAIVLSRYPGRVVRAKRLSRGDSVIYEIRVLGDQGRVRTVQIDAKTGQFL